MLAAYGCVRKPDLDDFNWKALPPLAGRIKLLAKNFVNLALIPHTFDPTRDPIWVALRCPANFQQLPYAASVLNPLRE